MDNKEIDKILKSKLQNRIKPSKEFEDRIKAKIEEQKEIAKQKASTSNNSFKPVENKEENANTQKQDKKKFYKMMSRLISVAAVFVVVLTAGIYFNEKEEIPNIPGISSNRTERIKIKAITPTKVEAGIIANDSEFIISVEGENTNLDDVRKSLYIEPALEYEITKTSNSEYKLKFKQNIPDNTLLKLQYVKDQITEDSWAYQTRNTLSVTNTYPANEGTVSLQSVIEIEFSYANVQNFEENVTITPSVEGNWEHIGKLWRFIPTKEFEDNTKYQVKINKNIKADNENLENDYIFEFTAKYADTYGRYYSYSTKSVDRIYTSDLNEPIAIYSRDDGLISEVKTIEIKKFENADEFIKYLDDEDYNSAKSVGNFSFNIQKEFGTYSIVLDKNLEMGYYIALLKGQNNQKLLSVPIQKNSVQAYLMETERDIVAWVAINGALCKDIPVAYLGKTVKTNEDGVAVLAEATDGSRNLKYVKIGENNPLVVGVNNFIHEDYPRAFIYTDRPLYKNTDTIKVWGFVPRDLFYDKIDEDEFYIYGLSGIVKQKVKIDENGMFKTEIKLKNQKDLESTMINLVYKNADIAWKQISIQNYELQNYSYEIIANKNYAFVGENFEFDVKATHISGMPVPNKSITIKCEEKTIRAKTDENGIAHISLKIEDSSAEHYTSVYYRDIEVYNGDDTEYTNYQERLELKAITRDVTSNTTLDRTNKTCDITLHKIEEKGPINIKSIEELYGDLYNTEIEIQLEERKWKRILVEHKYNEYTRENEPIYTSDYTNQTTTIKKVNTTNGNASINLNDLPINKNTESISYDYNLIFKYRDSQGRERIEKVYDIQSILYGRYNSETYGHIVDNYYGNEDIGIYDNSYYVYRYFLKTERPDSNTKKFNVGDKAKFELFESTKDGEKLVQNTGKLLKFVIRENIVSTEILSDNSFEYNFTEKDLKGCKITAAYFINGKFYRIPTEYFDYNEEQRKVEIDIKSDKQEYTPGDEVTLSIKTTNNNKPIKTFVNISVVNEAVFKLLDTDSENSILKEIYSNNGYSTYTYSSYLDYLGENIPGGEGGGEGRIRSKFEDTAYFETVETNNNGEATVKFKLPDNITTFRVTAHAANKDLYVGENRSSIVVKKDFFVQTVNPRGVKKDDDLVLTATGIADTNFDAEFEFKILELNKTITTTAKTNSITTANFGKLPVGEYTARIIGKSGEKSDGIEFKFKIIEAAQLVDNKTTANINEIKNITPERNPIHLEIYHKQMKQYLDYISFIESTYTSRLDTMVAYIKAQDIKEKLLGTENIKADINLGEFIVNGRYKNLESANPDLVLTVLIEKYTDYKTNIAYENTDNLYEYYLFLAAKGEPVLTDLNYLREDEDAENYNKLILSLSYEFLGDYKSARELFSTIEFTVDELQEYRSLIAISDTYINKEEAKNKINDLIKTAPANEYLRFAILSFFENNSNEMEKEETITINSKNLNETFNLNGIQIKTYTIYDEDLSNIEFSSTSNDIMVSYYYQTSLENVVNDKIKKDVKIKLDGKIEKGNEINLVIDFGNLSGEEGMVRIALPNSLRLARNYNTSDDNFYKNYYLQSNKIDYLTYYKQKGCSQIKIPLTVTLDGTYKLENIVFMAGDGIYHISNSIEF